MYTVKTCYNRSFPVQVDTKYHLTTPSYSTTGYVLMIACVVVDVQVLGQLSHM